MIRYSVFLKENSESGNLNPGMSVVLQDRPEDIRKLYEKAINEKTKCISFALLDSILYHVFMQNSQTGGVFPRCGF